MDIFKCYIFDKLHKLKAGAQHNLNCIKTQLSQTVGHNKKINNVRINPSHFHVNQNCNSGKCLCEFDFHNHLRYK